MGRGNLNLFLKKTSAKCCGESGLRFPSETPIEENTTGVRDWNMRTYVLPGAEITEQAMK